MTSRVLKVIRRLMHAYKLFLIALSQSVRVGVRLVVLESVREDVFVDCCNSKCVCIYVTLKRLQGASVCMVVKNSKS